MQEPQKTSKIFHWAEVMLESPAHWGEFYAFNRGNDLSIEKAEDFSLLLKAVLLGKDNTKSSKEEIVKHLFNINQKIDRKIKENTNTYALERINPRYDYFASNDGFILDYTIYWHLYEKLLKYIRMQLTILNDVNGIKFAKNAEQVFAEHWNTLNDTERGVLISKVTRQEKYTIEKNEKNSSLKLLYIKFLGNELSNVWFNQIAPAWTPPLPPRPEPPPVNNHKKVELPPGRVISVETIWFKEPIRILETCYSLIFFNLLGRGAGWYFLCIAIGCVTAGLIVNKIIHRHRKYGICVGGILLGYPLVAMSGMPLMALLIYLVIPLFVFISIYKIYSLGEVTRKLYMEGGCVMLGVLLLSMILRWIR